MHTTVDVLEQFNAPPKPAAQPAPAPTSSSHAPQTQAATTASAQGSQSQSKAPDPFAGLDEDFARELTKGMESLFRDIAQGAGLDEIPDLGKVEEGATDEEREKAFKAAWEAMLIEGMNGTLNADDLAGMGAGKTPAPAASTASGSGTTASTGSGAGVDSFQENIRKAMEKLKESDRMVR